MSRQGPVAAVSSIPPVFTRWILRALAIAVLAFPVAACTGEAPALRSSSPGFLSDAMGAEERGDLDEALRLYSEALREGGSPLRAAILASRLGLLTSRTQEVAAWLRRHARNLPPGQRIPFESLGALLSLDRRNQSPAVRTAIFEELRALDPGSPWPYLLLRNETRRYLNDAAPDSAGRLLSECIRHDPEFVPCRLGRASIGLRAGEPDAAIRDLRAAVDAGEWLLEPYAPRLRLAEALAAAGREDSAVAVLDRVASPGGEDRAQIGPWTQFRRDAAALNTVNRLLRTDLPGPSLRRLTRLRTELGVRLAALTPELPPGFARSKSFMTRSNLLRKSGAPDSAHALLEKALHTAPEGYVGWTAYLEQELCRSGWELGRLEEALPHCLASLKTFGARADSTELMSSAHVTSHVYAEMGFLYEARAYGERHLALAERVGFEGDRLSALIDLGWLTWRLGDRERARDLLGEMVELARENGRWLYEAASFMEATGNLGSALRLYHRGIQDSTPEAFTPYGNYARSLLGLSRVYLRLGRPNQALSYARAYEAHVEQTGSYELPPPNVADVLRAMGKHGESIASARRWLDILQGSGTAGSQAAARMQLARSLLEAGEVEEAIPILETLLETGARSGSPERRISLRLALADALLRTGRTGEVASVLETAERHARALRNEDLIWRVETLRGHLAERSGRPARALVHYRAAMDVLEGARARFASPEIRTDFLAARLDPYEAALRLRGSPGGPLFDMDEAFRLSERQKGRTLAELTAGGDARTDNEAPGTVTTELAHIRHRLTAIGTRLNNLDTGDSSSSSSPSSARQTRLRAEFDRLFLAYDELRNRLAEVAPRHATLHGLEPGVEREALQRETLAPSDASPARAIVEYASAGNRLLVIVITPRRFAVRALGASPSEIDSLVSALRSSVESLKRGEIGLAHVDWDPALAHRLYEILFAPVEDLLTGVGNVVIVPERSLWSLPFEALVVEEPQGSGDPARSLPGGSGAAPRDRDRRDSPLFTEYARLEFLIDRYTISYAPSASLVDPNLWRDRPASGRLLHVSTESDSNGRGSALLGNDQARQFARLTGDDPARYVVATESAFARQAPSFRFIHFDTHGEANLEEPGRSALILESDATSDGRLEAYEIAGLRLAAELVTLGACETGVGPPRPGEGSLALTRAFMAAGVPSVVASLWAVPAEANRIWPRFYQEIEAGTRRAPALRRAKLAVRRETYLTPGGTEVSLAHPVFWAPFALVGLP